MPNKKGRWHYTDGSGTSAIKNPAPVAVPDPVPPTHTITLDPSSGSFPTSGTFQNWDIERGPSPATMETFVDSGSYFSISVGGYSNSSHYSRIKRKLPEREGLVAEAAWVMTGVFWLPANFYTSMNGFKYGRLMNSDNIVGNLNGTSVGSSSGNEWRVGFGFNGSGAPRLMSQHQNHQDMMLWTGTTNQLSTQTNHTVEIDFTPSKTSGSWAITIDSVLQSSATGVQTVPVSVPDAEMIVTRFVWGMDGFYDQDSTALSSRLYGGSAVIDL